MHKIKKIRIEQNVNTSINLHSKIENSAKFLNILCIHFKRKLRQILNISQNLFFCKSNLLPNIQIFVLNTLTFKVYTRM